MVGPEILTPACYMSHPLSTSCIEKSKDSTLPPPLTAIAS